MAVEVREKEGGRILEVFLTGKLAGEDYQELVPHLERLVKTHGKIRLLVDMHDFHGWTAGALWQDLKFDVKHFNDIERVAFVCETKWERVMAAFCKPFTTAEVRYFDQPAVAEARAWLEGKGN